METWGGKVMGAGVWTSLNSTPSRARASMLGVVGRGKPYALRWSARSVSMLIRRTLRMAGRGLEQEGRSPGPSTSRRTKNGQDDGSTRQRGANVTARY